MLKKLDAAITKAAIAYTHHQNEVPQTVTDIKIETSQIMAGTHKANAKLDAIMLQVKSMEAKMDGSHNGGNEVPVDATPEDVIKQSKGPKSRRGSQNN